MRPRLSLFILAVVAAIEIAEDCNADVKIQSQSGLLGAGYSAPPEELELPSGWGLLSAAGRTLPIPLDKVGRIGLVSVQEQVGLIVLGTKNSEQLWTLSFFLTPSEIGPEKVPIEALISGAIESDSNQDYGLLDGFSSRHSTYAFRLGKDIALDAGLPGKNVWNVIWRNSSGRLILASWHLEADQEGILRAIDKADSAQSGTHPLQELLNCASDGQPFYVCREITLPGIEVVGWGPENHATEE